MSSDVVSFDEEAGERFTTGLQTRLASFDGQVTPEILKAALDAYLNVGHFKLTSYMTEVEADLAWVAGVVESMGAAPTQIANHELGWVVTIPTVDGAPKFSALSEEDLALLLEHNPEQLIFQYDLPEEVRAEAMHNFQVMHAGDLTVFSGSASINATVDIAWVEIGSGLQAGIEVKADGTTVLTYRASASAAVQADVGAAEAKAGGNGALTWQYTFPPSEAGLALLMLNDTSNALVDDLNPLDVNDVFEEYSDNQTGFIQQVGLEVGVATKPPPGVPVPGEESLSASFTVGGTMTWDSISGVHTRGLYAEGNVGGASAKIAVTESFAQNGQAVTTSVSLDLGAPADLGLPVDSGNVSVSVDMSDPRAVAALNDFKSDPLNVDTISSLLHVSTVSVATTRTVVDEESETDVGVVKVKAKVEAEMGVTTEIKMPHSDTFIVVTAPSGAAHTIAEQFTQELEEE